MRGSWTVVWLTMLTVFHTAFGQERSPEQAMTPTVPKPVVLSSRDKIRDSARYPLPDVPPQYADGKPLTAQNDWQSVPEGPAMADLTDPSALRQIPVIDRREKKPGKYYWHPYKGWFFCHVLQSGRQWYGWRTGGTFHWILWHSGRFWWRDTVADRWIFFDRGYWCWQGQRKPVNFQVLLQDGHYHVCNVQGVLGD